jgi:hypothetical protein
LRLFRTYIFWRFYLIGRAITTLVNTSIVEAPTTLVLQAICTEPLQTKILAIITSKVIPSGIGNALRHSMTETSLRLKWRRDQV